MKNTVNKIYNVIDILLGIMTGAMITIVFLNVVLRFVFNSGLAWAEELSRYLFVFVTYIGAMSAMRRNEHLGIDALVVRVNKKWKMFFYLLSQGLIAIVTFMVTYGSYKMVIQNSGARTAALNIPFSVLYGIGIVTGAVIAVNALVNISEAIRNPDKIDDLVRLQDSVENEEEIIQEALSNEEKLDKKSS